MFVVVTQDNQGGNQFINGPFETRDEASRWAQKHAGILAAEDEGEASGEDGEFWVHLEGDEDEVLYEVNVRTIIPATDD